MLCYFGISSLKRVQLLEGLKHVRDKCSCCIHLVPISNTPKYFSLLIKDEGTVDLIQPFFGHVGCTRNQVRIRSHLGTEVQMNSRPRYCDLGESYAKVT